MGLSARKGRDRCSFPRTARQARMLKCERTRARVVRAGGGTAQEGSRHSERSGQLRRTSVKGFHSPAAPCEVVSSYCSATKVTAAPGSACLMRRAAVRPITPPPTTQMRDPSSGVLLMLPLPLMLTALLAAAVTPLLQRCRGCPDPRPGTTSLFCTLLHCRGTATRAAGGVPTCRRKAGNAAQREAAAEAITKPMRAIGSAYAGKDERLRRETAGTACRLAFSWCANPAA